MADCRLAYKFGSTTTEGGAGVTIAFKGDSADVYGSVGSGAGSYSVSIDGTDAGTLSGSTSAALRNGEVLYSARGLGDGTHTLRLENAPGGGSLTVDFVRVFGNAPA